MSNNSNKGYYPKFILEPLGRYAPGSAGRISQDNAAYGVRSAIDDLARFNPIIGQILQKAGYNKIQFTDLLPPNDEGERAGGETDECADTEPGQQNEPDFRIGGRVFDVPIPPGSLINSRFATLHEFGHALNDLLGVDGVLEARIY
ncbi:MAG: hypothetical protein IPK73_21175 [Candidatus Obscuribacter sp.]|nr:hypothetical protein [Candidatus Obscuribacter sp.]MBK9276629.1 hypothetical protein [Candidatus Obscuribacter sp.]